ncbi:MAG: PHB depolymerase family esterase [Rhizobacter sp.]|nr:PHB depolymerase family esterase [Bacteriovorax sp.]
MLQLITSLVLLMLTTVFANVQAGTWKTGTTSSSNGLNDYRIYIPDNMPKGHKPALVVMLHGCDQNAEDFAKGSHIEQLAEKEKFIALFPEQNIMSNAMRCWNWYLPAYNSRYGESQSIMSMVDSMIEKYNIDSENVFAGGMSAGASMVSILGNCYPERFKALASNDGTQYYATATGMDFIDVVMKGATITSAVAAKTGFECSKFVENKPKQMPMVIFYGLNSPLMSPIHATQIEDEMKDFNDYLDNGKKDNSNVKSKAVVTVAPTKTSYGYKLYTTTNNDNQVFIERYMIDNLGHDWSGGVSGVKYNDSKGPDATALMIKFFKKFGL